MYKLLDELLRALQTASDRRSKGMSADEPSGLAYVAAAQKTQDEAQARRLYFLGVSSIAASSVTGAICDETDKRRLVPLPYRLPKNDADTKPSTREIALELYTGVHATNPALAKWLETLRGRRITYENLLHRAADNLYTNYQNREILETRLVENLSSSAGDKSSDVLLCGLLFIAGDKWATRSSSSDKFADILKRYPSKLGSAFLEVSEELQTMRDELSALTSGALVQSVLIFEDARVAQMLPEESEIVVREEARKDALQEGRRSRREYEQYGWQNTHCSFCRLIHPVPFLATTAGELADDIYWAALLNVFENCRTRSMQKFGEPAGSQMMERACSNLAYRLAVEDSSGVSNNKLLQEWP